MVCVCICGVIYVWCGGACHWSGSVGEDYTLGDVDIIRMSIAHFGDESASVTFRGDDKSQFSTRKEVTYHIASGRELYLTKNNYDNDIRGGLAVIASLHFGDFAGYSLRIMYFVLGIGT